MPRVEIIVPGRPTEAADPSRGPIPNRREPEYLPRRKLARGLGVRIFDLAYRLIGDTYVTQNYGMPTTVAFPFPANTYIDNIITPLLAALPATPMSDHYYQIPKRHLGMRTDNTHWPFYGLMAVRNPENDCYLDEFPGAQTDGTFFVREDAQNVNGELETSSTWWVLQPEWPFGVEQPPGWDNTLVTAYGFQLFLSTGVEIYPGYKVTALPDYDAPSVSIPALTETPTLDVFFPPWVHDTTGFGGSRNLTIIQRETWLDDDTIPADVTGSAVFNTILICILEGWEGQRFYIWDDDGVGQ
jgi:hypothetical protein